MKIIILGFIITIFGSQSRADEYLNCVNDKVKFEGLIFPLADQIRAVKPKTVPDISTELSRYAYNRFNDRRFPVDESTYLQDLILPIYTEFVISINLSGDDSDFIPESRYHVICKYNQSTGLDGGFKCNDNDVIPGNAEEKYLVMVRNQINGDFFKGLMKKAFESCK